MARPPAPTPAAAETAAPLPAKGGSYLLVNGQLVAEAEQPDDGAAVGAPETLPETGA